MHQKHPPAKMAVLLPALASDQRRRELAPASVARMAIKMANCFIVDGGWLGSLIPDGVSAGFANSNGDPFTG